MIRALAVGLALAASGSAWSQQRYASEPQPVDYFDVYNVFSILSYDTGFLPGQAYPVSVRFAITPTGGVVTEMEAISELEWPDTLEHRITGVPDGGRFEIDTEIEIESEVYLNLLIYTDYIPIYTETVSMYDGVNFTPMLLDGGEPPVSVSISGDGIVDPIEFALTVIIGIELVFSAEVYPEISATLSGTRVETSSDDGLAVQSLEDTWSSLPFSTTPPPELELSSTYIANYETALSLVLEPDVSVDTWIGNFSLINFPIPITLLDTVGERAFDALSIFHPLPLVGPLPGAADLGEVSIDNLANGPIELTNVGAMPLEGVASIVGSDDFTVFPETLFIPPGGSDGLMVTFDPLVAGDRSAVLEITTNDPLNPIIEIPLFASAFDPNAPVETGTTGTTEGPPDGLTDNRVSAEDLKGGCGCDSSANGTSPWFALGLLALFRRRSSRG